MWKTGWSLTEGGGSSLYALSRSFPVCGMALIVCSPAWKRVVWFVCFFFLATPCCLVSGVGRVIVFCLPVPRIRPVRESFRTATPHAAPAVSRCRGCFVCRCRPAVCLMARRPGGGIRNSRKMVWFWLFQILCYCNTVLRSVVVSSNCLVGSCSRRVNIVRVSRSPFLFVRLFLGGMPYSCTGPLLVLG